MVYTVDGIAGRDAKSAEKHLATTFVAKWNKPYSDMVFYANVRMALPVVRVNSLIIPGSRDYQRARQPVINDHTSM